MDYKDYYKILGVPKTATEKEIKTAYRKLARQFHPDMNQGDKKAEARFKEVGRGERGPLRPGEAEALRRAGCQLAGLRARGAPEAAAPEAWPGGGFPGRNVRVEFGEELGGLLRLLQDVLRGGGGGFGDAFGGGPGPRRVRRGGTIWRSRSKRC